MKKTWTAVGFVVLAAGILYYPTLQLYNYWVKKRAERLAGEEDEHGEDHAYAPKLFSPSYRSKHKPHHRHAANSQDN